jgi:hypothetical protein
MCEETSGALAVPYQEAKAAITQAETAHLDETGWKEKGDRWWLWVAVRALRGAVLWRKGCFGNQSGNGSQFTERILTTVATLKQQDGDIV